MLVHLSVLAYFPTLSVAFIPISVPFVPTFKMGHKDNCFIFKKRLSHFLKQQGAVDLKNITQSGGNSAVVWDYFQPQINT